jgi:hypothetical protein
MGMTIFRLLFTPALIRIYRIHRAAKKDYR